jgi:hypothetical protein
VQPAVRPTPANNIPILTGAALIREREHGTLAHLLVMLLTALGIWPGLSGAGRTEDERRRDGLEVQIGRPLQRLNRSRGDG